MLPARERADQQARDVGIEHRARRRLDEAAELAFVLRGAEPAPIADHVQIGAISEQRPLPDRREPGKGPARDRVPRKRQADALVVGRRRFGVHARARASLHLAREAGTQALLEPQRFPAERVLGRERAERFARLPPRREGSEPAGELPRFHACGRNERGRSRLRRQLKHAGFGLAPQRVVVRRKHRLDERGLAQERADLAGRFLEFDAPDLAREAKVGRRAVVGREVRADPLAQIRALSDVEGQRVEAVEEVDARRFGQAVEDVGCELRWQARRLQHALGGGFDRLRGEVAVERLHERPQHARVAQCAVPSGDGQCMPRDDAVEIVPRLVRKQPPRQSHRAQDARRERALSPRERVLEEAVVEAGVVRHEQRVGGACRDLVRDARERRCVANHFVGDARQRLDVGRDGHAGIDERAPLRDARRREPGGIGIDAHDADLRDGVGRGGRAGGFEVDEGQGGREQAHGDQGKQKWT